MLLLYIIAIKIKIQMKNKKMKNFIKLMLFILSINTYGCCFQPNDAHNIILLKEAEDTLNLSLLDSYLAVNRYRTKTIEDTLYIKVISFNHTRREIHIPFDTAKIKYVKLQNDIMLDVDSIPHMGERGK
jgi:hypothetical protein